MTKRDLLLYAAAFRTGQLLYLAATRPETTKRLTLARHVLAGRPLVYGVHVHGGVIKAHPDFRTKVTRFQDCIFTAADRDPALRRAGNGFRWSPINSSRSNNLTVRFP